MYYQNINGMRTKLQHFYQNVLNSNYDVICLTETNLISGIFDGEIIDSRYNIFRRDRDIANSTKESGGGVLIAVKKKFQVLRQAHWDSNQEDIWITIKSNNCHSPNINICVCYLPPDLNCTKRDVFYSNCQMI
jgi:exonuclease III